MERKPINVEIYRDRGIKVVTRVGDKKPYTETYPNEKAALNDKTELNKVYKVYAWAFGLGSIGGFIAAVDVALKSQPNHPPALVATSFLGFLFSYFSASAFKSNREKLKIIDAQINTLSESIELDKQG